MIVRFHVMKRVDGVICLKIDNMLKIHLIDSMLLESIKNIGMGKDCAKSIVQESESFISLSYMS